VQLCVLSARSQRQLSEQAAALALFVQTHAELDLADLAHTLQIGRSGFECRAAALFESRKDLLHKLRAIATEVPAEGVWRGVRDPSALVLLEDDPDGRELVRKWLSLGQLAKLAGPWTQGVSVDWAYAPGHGSRRRLRLPGYPFAADRHWVQGRVAPERAAATTSAKPAAAARLHPLIDRNASTLERARFAGSFSGDEAYLSHHLSGAERLLLGLFYPEMARAAGEMAAGRPVRALRRMVWGQPAHINGQPRDLSVVLAQAEEGLLYRICPDGDETRPCHLGELVLEGPEADWPTLPQLPLAAAGQDVTHAFLASAPRVQAVRQVWLSGSDLHAQIRLERGAQDAMLIDPLMLDVLWELVAFHEREQGLPGPRFPHALASLLQDGPLPASAGVHLWRRNATSPSLTLLLTDGAGRPCLLLDGLVTERVEALPLLHFDPQAVE
jgi:Polyketide synthase dehydratase